MRLRATIAVIAFGALGCGLVGCAGSSGSAGGSHSPARSAASSPSVAMAQVALPAKEVSGAALTVRFDYPSDLTVTRASQPDGSIRFTVRGPASTPPTLSVDRGTLALEDDGSVAVRDSSGQLVAGLAPASVEPDSNAAWRTDSASSQRSLQLGYAAPESRATPLRADIWFSAHTLVSAVWGDREGGRSLAVDLTAWGRHAGDAATELGWAEVIRAQPSASTASMKNQYECHAVGAPDKDTWNLEPWRPDVGLIRTMLARCNPTA